MDAAPAAAAPATPAPVDPAKVVADAAKPPAPAAPATPSADDVMKERLAQLAAEKEDLRKSGETHKERLSRGEKHEKAEALVKKGDYLGAIELMGGDPDDFYLKATDQINARTAAKKDPEAVARKLIEEHETKRQTMERETSEKNWKSAAADIVDQYPDVALAIAKGKISYDDVIKVAYAESGSKRDSAPAAVLKAIQEKLKPASADEKKPAAASGAPPSASGSHVPVDKPADEGDLSIDEAFERAKKKHFAK